MLSRSSQHAVRIAALTAACVIAQQIGSKATRDAFFLSNYSVTLLTRVMVLAALLSFVGAFILSSITARIGPVRNSRAAFCVSACLFLVEWGLAQHFPGPAAIAVYLHAATFGLIVISSFWSVVNERFDPHTARAALARIVAGATLGGVFGGVIAERVTRWFGLLSMLPSLALLNGLCALGVTWIGTMPTLGTAHLNAVSPQPKERPSALRLIRDTSCLRHFAAVMALTSLAAAAGDYALKAQAAVRFEGTDELMTFFAIFYGSVSLLSFGVQAVLGRSALRHLGIGGVMAVLPLAGVTFGAIGALFTRLWSVLLLRGSQSVLINSLFRSGYELLFTSVPQDKRRSTKIIIDVVFDRLGDALGSIGVLLIASFVADVEQSLFFVLALATVSSGAALGICRKLRRDYMDELVARLKGANIRASASSREHSAEPLTYSNSIGNLPVLKQVKSILKPPIHPEELTQVAALLTTPDVKPEISKLLQKLVPSLQEELFELLDDPDVAIEVRKHVIQLFAAGGPKKGGKLLTESLSNQSFELRYESAKALSQLEQKYPNLQLERQRILELARQEISRVLAPAEQELVTSQATAPSKTSIHPSTVLMEPLDQGHLEHVFTVLSLALRDKSLHLALQACSQGDAQLRGTALEYLRVVLPDEVRHELWPYLPTERRKPMGTIEPPGKTRN